MCCEPVVKLGTGMCFLVALAACGDVKKDGWATEHGPQGSLVDVAAGKSWAWTLAGDGEIQAWNNGSFSRVSKGMPCEDANGGGEKPEAMAARHDQDAWAVGGTLCHWNGSGWEAQSHVFNGDQDVLQTCKPFTDVTVSSSGKAWALSPTCILEWMPDGPDIQGVHQYWKAIPTSGVDRLCSNTCTYAGNGRCNDSRGNNTLCDDGTDCLDCGFFDRPRPAPTRLWASGEGNLWGIDDQFIYQWRDNLWQNVGMDLKGKARAIWGSSNDNIFVVADRLLRYNGVGWGDVIAPPLKVRGIGGTDGKNVWAVGADKWLGMRAELAHFNGLTWKVATQDKDLVTAAAWGVLGNEVVGSITGEDCCVLNAVTVVDADHIWVVGEKGTVLRMDPFQRSMPGPDLP